jgi:DNA replication and repair protein RecF
MFEASDLEIVLGAPSVRRRYLDILISQLDRDYLTALQRYQRVISQRNYLLKAVREGRGDSVELDFWDGELVASGAYLAYRRSETVSVLSGIAAPIHTRLADGESLDAAYGPSGGIALDGSEAGARRSLAGMLEERRPRDIGQGFTSGGPHRDDMRLTLDGLEAGLYASRGQSRTVALAMKLAEAAYLRDQRGEEPVLLLDDVLSELDERRRLQVLEAVAGYEQSFITTSDPGQIDDSFLERMTRFVVSDGTVTAAEPAGY